MRANIRTRAALTAGIMLSGLTTLLPSISLSQTATPGNITGRWSVIANNTSITLRITQAGNGAISGTMTDQGQSSSTLVEGYYIPSVRRLVFIRKLSNGTPTQFYSAWNSTNGLQLGGQFNIWNTANGASASGVDFNFRATKTSDFPD